MVTKRDTEEAVRQEMRRIVHLAAEPIRPHDNATSLIARAAAVLHLTYRRTRSLWYGEERALIRDAEAARLRLERDRLLAIRLARLEQEISELRRQLDAEAAGSVAPGATGTAGAPAPLAGGVC